MGSDADPRGSWAFRRRVALARAAGGFETVWSAVWPSLMVVGAFLVVSLLGLWAILPAWLHGLGLLAFLAALGWTAWRSRAAWRWPNRNAGLRRLERVNRLPHQPLRSLGDRLSGGSSDPATQVLWRRHVERLRQAVRGLRVGLPRSDLPWRDPWALRVAIALLLVVAVVGVARAIGGSRPVESVGSPPLLSSPTTSSELGDDSVANSESPPVATAIPGAAAPDVVALDFTRAWLRSKGVTSAQWVKGLQPYVTPRLLEQYKDADPESVPAESIRGPALVRVRDSQLVEVDVPVTPGTLKLRLLVANGRWLVDGVSWEQS